MQRRRAPAVRILLDDRDERAGSDVHILVGREFPIPAKLTKKLKTWKAKADKTCNLVFPTSGCNPKLISSAVGKRVPNVQNSTRTTFGYTSFVRHLRRGACGLELICAPCSDGWDTPT